MNKNLLFATVVSALGSFLFGFDTAVISGTTKFISEYFSLTDTTLGITVSIALWGTVLGAIIVAKPGDLKMGICVAINSLLSSTIIGNSASNVSTEPNAQ